jgi:hypothetical protein
VLIHSRIIRNEVPFASKLGAYVSLSCEPPISEWRLINLAGRTKSQSGLKLLSALVCELR